MSLNYLGAVGGTTAIGGSGKVLPVQGQGLQRGSQEGLVAYSLRAGGPARWEYGDGVGGDPRLTLLPALTEIARATIDLASPLAQRIEIIPDLEECEVERVSFRRFSAQPAASVRGGIYAAPPVGSNSDRVNPSAAAIVDEGTGYDAWAGGLTTLRPAVIPAVRRLVALWWCPRLVAGAASPSATPLTCEVVVYGLPKWQV